MEHNIPNIKAAKTQHKIIYWVCVGQARTNHKNSHQHKDKQYMLYHSPTATDYKD
jgi:hypothetical protein